MTDIEIETAYDPDTDESNYERVDGSSQEIVKRLLGRELASYL